MLQTQIIRAIRPSALCILLGLSPMIRGWSMPGASVTRGDLAYGTVTGATHNASGQPLAQVQIVVYTLDANVTRTVASDGDGAFMVRDLEPGHYQLSAIKAGFSRSPAVDIELVAGQNLHCDFVLRPRTSFKTVGNPALSASSDCLGDSVSAGRPVSGFFSRLAKTYADDWKGSALAEPQTVKRGYPSPESSPPYPFSDWPYGGSPDIGAPWTQASPLMETIWSGPHGQAWKDSGIQVYGWLDGGLNVSTSNRGGYANLPAAYDEKPNTFQPDQEALYIERQPDTVQTDHFDWGFRVANLWGIDYRFTTAKGVFSQQLLKRNQEYGYDTVMAYTDLYWGQVADGLNLRIGRFISVPDIEAQLAPNNYTYSHSLLYTYDCYTQTGIEGTLKLNNHWLLQSGLSAGCEAVPWTHPDAKPTFNLGLQYTWNGGNDAIYPVLNALNDGKYAYNNLNSFYVTWYHKVRSHPSVHLATEYWYMWEKNVPNVNNPQAASLLETNANGASCSSPSQVTCFAPEWAVLNYTEKQLSAKDYLSIRNEYFDDIKGQRTGFKTIYTEHLIGWGHWIGTTILIRPEIRFEHSYDAPAYDDGAKKSQLTFAGDVIYFF